MAIYHLHVKNISRGKGHSAIASASYRRAARLFSNREEKYHDYTSKRDVVHSEISIPENSPSWLKELVELHSSDKNAAAERLWNQVEFFENRSDSRLAKEVEFALPIELSQEENIKLAREYLQDQFCLRGMIADWNIHWDDGNPHVHVMLTTRQLTEDGFGYKVREWNSDELIKGWREQWSEYANFHLRLHGHQVTIDHRSYADQGIDLIPTVHVGKAVTDMDRRGMKTQIMDDARNIQKENLKRIASNPDIFLKKVSSKHESFTSEQLGHELGKYVTDKGGFSFQESGLLEKIIHKLDSEESLENAIRERGVLTPRIVAKILKTVEHHESAFTVSSLARVISSYTNNAEIFSRALLELKQSSELIYLGLGQDGKERYTTKRMFQIENNIQQMADDLKSRRHLRIHKDKINKHIAAYQKKIGKELTPEQITAVNHLLKTNSISCLVGVAGAGKSFSLGVASEVWKSHGAKVYGIALSGVAAAELTKSANIRSRTIKSFQTSLEKGVIKLERNDVVVMDEAGMTDSVSMEAVLKAVYQANAKLCLIGDPAQLQPIGPGAAFRALIERIKPVRLQIVYRQNAEWQRTATTAFSNGDIAEGFEAYYKNNCVHFERTEQDALFKIVNDWFDKRQSLNDISHEKLNNYLVLAFRNSDVWTLNSLIREGRISRGEISEGYVAPYFIPSTTRSGETRMSDGDRIIFLERNDSLGVNNGYFATIKKVNFTESGKVINFIAKLDINGREVCINPSTYKSYTHGYAATTHKAQGATVDHTLVYMGGTKMWDKYLTYVSMSRHRETCNVYADKSTHGNMKYLTKALSRYAIKDSVLDYPLAFANRRGIEDPNISTTLSKYLTEKLKVMKDKIVEIYKVLSQSKQVENNKEIINSENTIYMGLSEKTQKMIMSYLDSYIEFNEASTQKVKQLGENPRLAQKYAQAANVANKKMGEIATALINKSDFKKFITESHEKQNGQMVENKINFMKICRDKFHQHTLTVDEMRDLVKNINKKALLHNQVKTINKQRDQGGDWSY